MDDHDGIKPVQVNPKYLHSNSTSHKWPFSAVAELIDNAYDPDVLASRLDIDYESFATIPCLTFTDDGNGLEADGMHSMFSYGYSDKEDIHTPKHLAIGQYGNGFKSGSMRLGSDAILFSIKNNTKTIGFMSSTYLKKINANTLLVPIVSWNLNNELIKKEDTEPSLKAILQHSIFKDPSELFDQFKFINGNKGTRIIIYNLKRDNSNRLELDFMTDRNDIMISEECDSKLGRSSDRDDSPEHTYSLRAYCSILYMKPGKLRIHLRKKRVRALFVEKSLRDTETDTYRPNHLKMPVKITFGFNPKKNQYGMLMYNKNRLIKRYVKVGCQNKPGQLGVGVLGVIECNFLKLTHNKQDFMDDSVYRSLIKALGTKLNDYWNMKKGIQAGGSSTGDVNLPEPADEPDYNWIQCDRCEKWRKLPPGANMTFLETDECIWYCENNPDADHAECDKEEEEQEDAGKVKPSYDKGELKRKKQAAEKQRKEEEERRKKEVSAGSAKPQPSESGPVQNASTSTAIQTPLKRSVPPDSQPATPAKSPRTSATQSVTATIEIKTKLKLNPRNPRFLQSAGDASQATLAKVKKSLKEENNALVTENARLKGQYKELQEETTTQKAQLAEAKKLEEDLDGRFQELVKKQKAWEEEKKEKDKKAAEMMQQIESQLKQVEELQKTNKQYEDKQEELENLRINVHNLLRTELIDKDEVDNHVEDSRSIQVDDLLQVYLDQLPEPGPIQQIPDETMSEAQRCQITQEDAHMDDQSAEQGENIPGSSSAVHTTEEGTQDNILMESNDTDDSAAAVNGGGDSTYIHGSQTAATRDLYNIQGNLHVHNHVHP